MCVTRHPVRNHANKSGQCAGLLPDLIHVLKISIHLITINFNKNHYFSSVEFSTYFISFPVFLTS